MFDVLSGCGAQLRTAGMAGVPVGLDFSAVMALGQARGANSVLLAEVLPAAERAILSSLNSDADPSGEDLSG